MRATTELVEAAHSGVTALGRYKLRTTLSVLGVVLGVAGVVAMVSVGEGARRQTLAQMQALGLDNIVARSRTPSAPGIHRSGLGLQDAVRIGQLVPNVALTSPLIQRRVRLHGASDSGFTTILGVAPAFATILRLRLSDGRFLSPVDERQRAATCVLGAELASKLDDGRGRIVGKYVRLGAAHCQVVGVLERSGRETTSSNDPAWRNLDDAALVPTTVLSGRTEHAAPDQPIDELWLQMEDAESIEPGADVLRRALAAGGIGQQDVDFIIPRQLLAQRQRTHQTFNVVIGSIAAMALLVGGIGVMNVMLMSVVERTYEIGVRRAVGARRGAIGRQFLFEALLMTTGGGVAGILLGVVLSRLVTWYAGWPTSISAGSIGAAIIVSGAVGIGFGLYPAITAARLIPMDALRRE